MTQKEMDEATVAEWVRQRELHRTWRLGSDGYSRPIVAADDIPDRVGPRDAIHDRAYDVLGDIGSIVKPVRDLMRKALDKVDAPLTGRAKGDAAVGKAFRYGP